VRGIERFRQDIAELIPSLADRVDALKSMDDVKHLDVRLNRLNRWHVDGLLCIGDAAHAMSPVGGVGINLAVQDAVAAATLLAEPLRRGAVTLANLARVRVRRLLPTILVQALQRLMHRGLVAPIVEGRRMGPPKPVLAPPAARSASVVHTGLPHRRGAAARARAGVRQGNPHRINGSRGRGCNSFVSLG